MRVRTCVDVDQSRAPGWFEFQGRLSVPSACGRASRPATRPPPAAADDFNILVLKNFYQSDYFNFFAVK